MNWKHKDVEIKKIEDFKESAIGFIYEVEFSNGKKYLGRKALYHNRTLPPLKGYKRKRKVVVESDWKKYYGSSKDPFFKADIKSGKIVIKKKDIIKVCDNLWDMTYYENKLLFERDCILKDEYYNNNIMGKFYRPRK